MPLPRFFVLLTALWIACAVSVASAQSPTPSRRQRTPRNTQPQQPPPLPDTAPTPIPNAPGLVGRGSEPVINPTVTGNPAPGVTPASAVTPAPAAEKADVRLDFTNSPIADVLRYYENFSGKHVIVDNTVQGQINLSVNNITRTQAIHIIEMALNLNGFSVVQAEDNVVKVIGLGKPVRPAGPPIYLDVKDVPDNEQVATLLVRLNFLEPQETQGILNQYIPPTAAVGFIALQKAGALLLTDTGRSLKRLYALIQQIDVSPLSVEDRFFRLERADVTKAVEFLNSVFETKGGGATPGATGAAVLPGTTRTVNRPIRRVGEDGANPDAAALAGINPALGGGLSSNGDTLIVGRITMTPDVRTNRVHVVTNRRNMAVVERLLEEFDAETQFATPVRRPLRFVSAQDVLPILVQSITEPGSENANGTGTGNTPGATNPNRNGSSNSNNLFNNLNSNSNSSSGGNSGGSSNVGSEGLDTQTVDTRPTEQTVGNTKLIADQRSNTIIVIGGAGAREKVFEVLDQIDVPAPQVVIRTIIGELSLTDDKEFGLNYLLRTRRGTLLSQFNAGQLGTTPAASPSGSPGSTLSTLTTAATLASGLSSSFSGVGGIIAVGNSLDIIASALDSTSRFKTISNPVIFTQNNKKAIIASGQEIAVPSSQVGSTNGTVGGTVGTYTNVEYKNVTLQLEVVPLINSKEINLDILQKIDSVVAGGGTTVNGTVVPTIATRYLKSNVSAPNGSTIVLGGLITQNENKSNNDIPYLSKIPVLGKILFSTRTRDNDRSELIILMHPEVISTPAMLASLREREGDRSYLGTHLEEQLDKIEVRKAIPVTTTTTVRAKKTTVTVPAGK